MTKSGCLLRLHSTTIMMDKRQYDIVLLGATGFTGKLCAEHIATHLPVNLNWAVAGRSSKKLESLVDELISLHPDRLQPGMTIHLQLSDITQTTLRY